MLHSIGGVAPCAKRGLSNMTGYDLLGVVRDWLSERAVTRGQCSVCEEILASLSWNTGYVF